MYGPSGLEIWRLGVMETSQADNFRHSFILNSPTQGIFYILLPFSNNTQHQPTPCFAIQEERSQVQRTISWNMELEEGICQESNRV